ncbi:MAG: hypothetical protein RSC43_01000 [Clostridia bacterium]
MMQAKFDSYLEMARIMYDETIKINPEELPTIYCLAAGKTVDLYMKAALESSDFPDMPADILDYQCIGRMYCHLPRECIKNISSECMNSLSSIYGSLICSRPATCHVDAHSTNLVKRVLHEVMDSVEEYMTSPIKGPKTHKVKIKKLNT